MEHLKTRELGFGQVALELGESIAAPADQLRDLVRISDPALSELGFEPLLDELLVRVQDLLDVDTAAILLIDRDTDELVARAAKGIEEEVEQGVRIPIGRGFAGRIARERVAIFIADVDHADIMNPILRQKGIRSLLGVPLIVQGGLIGVLHVGSLTPREFDLRDLAVLELAAARAAPAIERSRLLRDLEREHRNAMTLQRSLLPRRLGTVPGVSIAARYIPARDEVGGDWYDIVEMTDGRVALVIGDVVGHGLAAATLMGQLRTALHAYAYEGHPPGRALELVDRFAASLEEDAMATAAVALMEPESSTVRYASAGHLPPVHIPADGSPRLVELQVAPPLGAFGHQRCPETTFELPPGDILMLYTDGLVERPRQRLSAGLEILLDAVAHAETPEVACLLAMDRLLPQLGPRDDVAAIALRHEPAAEVLECEYPADPRLLVGMRRELTRWLHSQDIDREVTMEIVIAVSEAAANAVEHAYGPGRGRFRVRAERQDGAVQLVVSDEGHWRPPRGENRGRGLKIMNAAMDNLDVRSTDVGTEIIMRRHLGER